VDEERRIAEVKLRDDVLLHGGRGGCCERNDWRGAKRGQVFAESAIVGTKVVAPGADAVSLVDRNQARFTSRQHLREAGNAHPFGRDEEEVQRAVEVLATGLTGFFA